MEKQKYLQHFEDWFKNSEFEQDEHFPERMEKLIQVLEILKTDYSLDTEKLFDDNGNLRINKKRKIEFVFDPKLSTWQIISNLLEEVINEGKGGYVAQHLVGAKLQLRFPDIKISNESASTADRPTNRQGDFLVGNTVFHVTVAPMQGVFEKCLENLKEGLKVYLLVPNAKLAAARELAGQFGQGQIAVESLESFVSQNIEEISLFTSKELKSNLATLIKIYNERVDAVEIDKSLMIELPANLKKYYV